MRVLTEELLVDARLAAADPAVPGFSSVLDLPVDRLRYKPGTSLRAAVVRDGEWELVTAYSRDSWEKVGKDVRAARGRFRLDTDRLTLTVPARTDRALPWLRDVPAAARVVAHNPARRSVLRGERCYKVHADPHTADRSARVSKALRRKGISTPGIEVPGRHVAVCDWVPGVGVEVGEEAAVAELVGRWSSADVRGLPVLGAGELREAVDRAVAGTVSLDEEFTYRLARVAARWRASSEGVGAEVFAHGDLSPDQLLRADGDLVVLDLDRACRAPRGWDEANWTAAVRMTGSTSTLSAPSVLVAAAALLRAPEPFRRRRSGWAAQTRALLELAEEAMA